MVSKDAKTRVVVPFDQIVRVQKNSYRIRHHTLIGLAVGAAVGLWVACSADDCSSDPIWLPIAGGGAGIGAGIGSGVGAILNAINHDSDILYDNNRRTTTMTVAPILSPARKGIVFQMTWR
jgi:hypothetical protein